MDVSEVLNAERSAVESELESFFAEEMSAQAGDPLITDVLESIREFTMREAKRVRSVLAVMGYKAVGGKDIKRARRASIALELVQSMLLVHDDIIDRSEMRRGRPSLHVGLSGLHERRGYRGDPSGFGTNMAIIAGDLSESFAEKALLRSGFPDDRILQALSYQTDMIRDTGYGQALDLFSVEVPQWSEEMVMKVHTYKTARYTLDGPLLIGAALHGASMDQMSALSGYAIPVGIAFQIVDDILGFFGDPKRGGTSDLSDIKEGKRTLLVIKALEFGTDEQRERILRSLGDQALTVDRAEEVREIIRRTGSERYSREMAALWTEKGIKALEGADLDADVVDFLRGFAGYLMGRA